MTRILVVHEDPDFSKFVRMLLQMVGYECKCTGGVKEPLSIMQDLHLQDLQDEPFDFDLLIVSLFFDLRWYYQLRKTYPNLKSIGYVLLGAADWISPPDHIDSYISLPFAVEDLYKTVESVLTQYGKPLPTTEERRVQLNKLKQEFG